LETVGYHSSVNLGGAINTI